MENCAHVYGEIEFSRFAGNPHRRCEKCNQVSLDLDEVEERNKMNIDVCEVARVLMTLKNTIDEVRIDEYGDNENYLDVRLQVTGSENDGYLWAVRYGDSSYDLDGRGFWGSATIDADLTYKAALSIATDLIEQCAEHEALEND